MIKKALLATVLLAAFVTPSQARPKIWKVLENMSVSVTVNQPGYYYQEQQPVYYVEQPRYYVEQPQQYTFIGGTPYYYKEPRRRCQNEYYRGR